MNRPRLQAHGGALTDPLVDPERRAELQQRSRDWPSWDLTPRQRYDLELLLSGAFSPLRGFLGREDYDSVCQQMRLADGTLWPLPVVLDLDPETAARLEPGARLALRDPEGVMLAALQVQQVWQPDRRQEARLVFGSDSPQHAGVDQLLHRVHPMYVGGKLEGIQLPQHYDFRMLRHTPRELRSLFARRGWRKVLAFQTRNPMHRVHQAITFRAAREHQANLLIHPAVGPTKPGDVDHFTRVRCYQAIMAQYPRHTAMLSLLPLSMRMAGPREALLHAIIRRNYGCTHFIVGRDHAGPGNDADGRPFYEPYAAQELMRQHQQELQIQLVPSMELVHVEQADEYLPVDEVPPGARVDRLSGTELRRRLARGLPIPRWFSSPEVIREMRRTFPPRSRQGLTVFFTGLSGAGKSTVANVLLVKLMEMGGRPVTLLDGDIVRKNLSSELTFSREHRDLNIRRIGFVAAEITKNGGIAICAPIAPYDGVRQELRQMISGRGGFVLVHVCTPLAVCERRDRKGMYRKARAGIIKQFTGISDPYEEPADAEVSIDTADISPAEAAQQVLLYLEKEGFIDLAGED
ncbi:MAG: bifunctional sulfate adenylyltransferase/adenylylsulfate kinase [Myxococcales bacterium]|jgi:sulfate adenylyltransferase